MQFYNTLWISKLRFVTFLNRFRYSNSKNSGIKSFKSMLNKRESVLYLKGVFYLKIWKLNLKRIEQYFNGRLVIKTVSAQRKKLQEKKLLSIFDFQAHRNHTKNWHLLSFIPNLQSMEISSNFYDHYIISSIYKSIKN